MSNALWHVNLWLILASFRYEYRENIHAKGLNSCGDSPYTVIQPKVGCSTVPVREDVRLAQLGTLCL